MNINTRQMRRKMINLRLTYWDHLGLWFCSYQQQWQLSAGQTNLVLLLHQNLWFIASNDVPFSSLPRLSCCALSGSSPPWQADTLNTSLPPSLPPFLSFVQTGDKPEPKPSSVFYLIYWVLYIFSTLSLLQHKRSHHFLLFHFQPHNLKLHL